MRTFVACALMAAGGCVASAQPVQWRVEDGGNGHWYQVIAGIRNIRGTAAELAAASVGGHLLTVASPEEMNFVVPKVNATAATLCPLGLGLA